MHKRIKKGLIILLISLLVIDVPFILYLLNFKLVTFSESFYKKEFKKHNIYEEFPEEDILAINSKLLYYLRYDKTDDYVNIDMFDEREKAHLKDVRDLVQKVLILYNVLLVILIVFILSLSIMDKEGFKKNIGRVMLFGGGLTFVDAILFFIMVKVNFSWFFDKFHKTFFKDGTWLFEEGTEMVRLYTSQFFYDATIRIAIYTLSMALVLVVSGWYLLREKNDST